MDLEELRSIPIEGGSCVHDVLDAFHDTSLPPWTGDATFLERVSRGIAFATFAYDIDGVSIEIAKYATAFERLFERLGTEARIHCIGGNFAERADRILAERWKRHRVPNTDGWSKWEDGRWFSALFYRSMPEGSEVSSKVARAIWRRAVAITEHLTALIREQDIGLLFVVNVNSNPGNFAYALATVLTSQVTGCPVICNNHDFYWEGGRPAEERKDPTAVGPRDHFFKNRNNKWFFHDFEEILPWNGRRWVQVNINTLQSAHLVERNGIGGNDTFEIGTSVSPDFFATCSHEERTRHRRRMACILSEGDATCHSSGVDAVIEEAGAWIRSQHPIVVGRNDRQVLDPADPDALWFLQPTRIVARKRIDRDWQLLERFLELPEVRERLRARPGASVTLHITGPVPVEHKADFERVLVAYRDTVARLPDDIAERVFMVFTVGVDDHVSLHENGLGPLTIADIYKMANVVLFPSLTEGRGLPIPEAAAAGVPMVCARYEPEEVFAAVVGEGLPETHRFRYLLFPDTHVADCARKLQDLITSPEALAAWVDHNRAVARGRFSEMDMSRSLERILSRMASKVDS